MDEMEHQIMFEMSEKLQEQKQSAETIKFQIEKLLQSQAKLIQSQAKLIQSQKNLMTMMPRFFEECHQTQETVMNPDPLVETVKNSDPLIEPLDCSSVLQVLASVPDALRVDRVDSHVKEVEESSQQSTNGNDKIVAHQLFDQMPNEYQKDLTVISNKEVLSFSHKDARVWEPGGLPTKMDHWDWFEKELKPHGESHKVATFLYSQMQVVKSNPAEFKTLDRKKSNKTLYLEDEHEQKEVTKFISSWNNRVWEPGGVLIELDKWNWLEKCYNRGLLMRLMHWTSSMSWKETKSREFARLSACSCVVIKTWHCVEHDIQQTDFHVWHRWKNKAEKLEVSVVCSEKRWFFVVYAVSAYDRTIALENESFLPPKIIREFESKIIAGMSRGQNTHHHHGKDYENEKLYLLGIEVKRVHMLLLLKEIVKASVEIMDCYKLTVFVNGLRYLMKKMDCVDNVILFTSYVKLLFPKNHKLLHYEADFCAQYNDLKQLNTEHQSSPGLYYFAYLIFIWNQALNCGCEAGHISSGFSSVGDVHEFFTCSKLQNGDETYGKELLDMNEISLLDNDIKIDFTIWCYHKPMIREVFHLQRPPEVIDLQGKPNFITKVPVQWKEHPPDQFFSSFYRQVLMLSSLRTRMF